VHLASTRHWTRLVPMIPSTRADGRAYDEHRPVEFGLGVAPAAQGSVLICCGNTRVICAASVVAGVPDWMAGRGVGWLTAEYAMLPYATRPRSKRELERLSGRTQEIRRLIGRSLRASLDMAVLGERTVCIDADVLEADGGTRTAAITGGWVALTCALQGLVAAGELPPEALPTPVAAISVGIWRGQPILDLCYAEDSQAEVDLNVVMDGQGRYVEVQGTAEGQPFARTQLDAMLGLAEQGIHSLLSQQRAAVGGRCCPGSEHR
jgi:ribonuclease PH